MTWALVQERSTNNRINTSNSVVNTVSNNDSYYSQKNAYNAGYISPGIPHDGNNTQMSKKSKRKAFTTAKKKLGSVNMNTANEKSVSPSLKLRKKKEKSMPFMQTNSTKISRVKPENDSANTSFTLEGNRSAMDGKNLIDEFNQKYATAEKMNSSAENFNQNDSESSENEQVKTTDTTLNENVAVIHVIDETKKRKQDFKCSISKLLKHMKYFEK